MKSLFKLITIIPSMDDCWMINIKAPAQLDVQTGEVDEEGFQVGLLLKSWKENSTNLQNTKFIAASI